MPKRLAGTNLPDIRSAFQTSRLSSLGVIDGVAHSDRSLPPATFCRLEQDMTKGFFDDLQNMVG